MRMHPAARPGLAWWLETMQRGTWRNLVEMRRTFPAADPVKVASGRQVIVFNIAGKAFRLIAAVHFNTGLAYALAFMSHAERLVLSGGSSRNRTSDTRGCVAGGVYFTGFFTFLSGFAGFAAWALFAPAPPWR